MITYNVGGEKYHVIESADDLTLLIEHGWEILFEEDFKDNVKILHLRSETINPLDISEFMLVYCYSKHLEIFKSRGR